jgi:glyoxylase-like metal-dependent hydrolase (beta-lactamase superfamily II)
MGFRNIRAAVGPLLRENVVVLNTHWHFDHVGGNALFKKRGIAQTEAPLVESDWPNPKLLTWYVEPCLAQGTPFPVGFVPQEYSIQGTKATFYIEDESRFDLGGRVLEAISTPGHTHGSMSFLDSLTHSLFSGDSVYCGILYAQFEDSDIDEYIDSLDKLLHRNDQFNLIYPAHAGYPLPKSWLISVRDGFQKVKDGTIHADIVEEWGEPVYSYQLDSFGILAKTPNSKGVNLLAFP